MSFFGKKSEPEVKEPPFYRSFAEYLRQNGLSRIFNNSYYYKQEYNNNDFWNLPNDFNIKIRSMSDKEIYHEFFGYYNKYIDQNNQFHIYFGDQFPICREISKDNLLKKLKESYEEDNKGNVDIDDLARRLESKIKVQGDNKELEKKINRVEQFTAGIMDKVNVLAELVDQKSDERITAYLIAIMNKLGITEQCPICFKPQLLISLHEVKEGASEHKVCQECKDKLTGKDVPKRLQRCPICRVNLAGVANDVYPRESLDPPRLERSLSRASMNVNIGN